MNLAQWQTDLVHNTLTNETSPALTQHLLGQLPRLTVYQNNVRQGLKHALKVTYPIIFWLLGKTKFDLIATDYVDRFLPIEANLNNYGDQLSHYFEQNETVDTPPYLADLARLEWYRQLSYYAADDVVISQNTLSALAKIESAEQGDVVFVVRTNIQLMASYFDLTGIWEGYAQHKASVNEKVFIVEKQPTQVYLCIHRPEYQAVVTLMSETDSIFFTAIQAQKTLADMVMLNTADTIDNRLPHYIANGYISGFYVKNDR
jgi:hypothetical protein